MTVTLIAPSILSADFADLATAMDSVSRDPRAENRADWLHVDVMDNHFVPNLTLGLPVVKSLLKRSHTPIDCHLMITEPAKWAPGYAEAGAYNVTFHVEASDNPVPIARDIQAAGALAGLAIKPGTPIKGLIDTLDHFDTVLIMSVEPGFGGQSFIPDVLDKVVLLRKLIDDGKLDAVIEIDGGINPTTIAQASAAGVDCFVAGSAIYGNEDPAKAIGQLRLDAQHARIK